MCPKYLGSLRSLNFVSTILWKPSFCLFIYLFIYLLIFNCNCLTFPFKVADQQAAVFGQCCFDVGDVNCTMGTGSFIDINTGSYPHASVAGNSKLRSLHFTGLQLLRWTPHGRFDLRYALIEPRTSSHTRSFKPTCRYWITILKSK